MDHMDRYYKILGINTGASKEEIRQAYRDMLKVWHPDRFALESPRLQEKAEDNAKKINEAYEKLMSLGPGVHSNSRREQSDVRDAEGSRRKTRETRRKRAKEADQEWEGLRKGWGDQKKQREKRRKEFWKIQGDLRIQREKYTEEFWKKREDRRRQMEKLWEGSGRSHEEPGKDQEDLKETQDATGGNGFLFMVRSKLAMISIIVALMCVAAILGVYIFRHLSS